MVSDYGQRVEYKNKIMTVSIVGRENTVIVLLPGLGSPSPVIEFKALSSFLANKYKVITIEYLGYGISDRPDTERSLENIAEELHYCMTELKCDKYILAAHSLSGIYCLYYANKYPNEVEGFIGIDSSVPQQIEDAKLMDANITALQKDIGRSGSKLYRWGIHIRTRVMMLYCRKDYRYSKEDITTYADLWADGFSSENALNELKTFNINFKKLIGVKFPLNIPVLFILARHSMKQISNWYEWHEELLGNNKGRIVVLEGRHYLHLMHPKETANEIELFLNS